MKLALCLAGLTAMLVTGHPSRPTGWNEVLARMTHSTTLVSPAPAAGAGFTMKG